MTKALVNIIEDKMALLTFGFITWNHDCAFLFDMRFCLGVAATSVQSSVIDTQDHPISEALSTCHCTLERDKLSTHKNSELKYLMQKKKIGSQGSESNKLSKIKVTKNNTAYWSILIIILNTAIKKKTH